MTDEHISSEEAEQKIIRMAGSFPALKHDYDDCGHLANSANSIEHFVIALDNAGTMDWLPKNIYLDGLLALHTNKALTPEQTKLHKSFFSHTNRMFEERNIKLCKGETTFINGKPYAVLALTMNDANSQAIKTNHQIIGTIDSYVSGRHFREKENTTNPGFYASLAAISDIGANGGTPLEIYLTLINPSRKKGLSS